MNRATFFKHFELLADQPDAVAKMRELVLQLAVQGKLVDQDPKDEPASKLLEQIQIQNQNRTAYHAVSAENAPYKAPTNWIWVKLGFLAEIERGGSPRPIKDYITDDPDGLNWIKIGDTEKGGKFITSTEEKIRKEGLKKTRKVYPGDFLLTNSMSFGRPYITKIEGCIHDGWLRIHPPRQITSDYLYCLLSSPFVYAFFSKAAAGAVVQNLNADKVRELPVPLPPLAEQRRIVAKVDELMALCGELEQRQQARQHARGQLQQSALHHLLAAREPQTFAAAWQRVRDHFHLLHDTPDAIPQLRQAILQLAVQGRLVPQNPKDEPASKLLHRIRDDKSQLIEGRKQRAENCIRKEDANETPYEIPEGWVWSVLDDVASFKNGKAHEQIVDLDGKYVLVNSRFVSTGGVTKKFAREILTPLTVGEIAIVMSDVPDGRALARCFIIDRDNHYTLNQRIGALQMLGQIESAFAHLVLDRNSHFLNFNDGKKQTNLKMGQILSCPFPIPPLGEQKRIVARVEELLRWCDTLEAQLHQTRTLGALLLDSTLHHLLAA